MSDDGAIWHPAGKTFLFPKTALATLARARFRDAFARLCPAADLPPHVWQIPWVVHITPWGQGQQAALDYLYTAAQGLKIAPADKPGQFIDGVWSFDAKSYQIR